MKCLLRTEIWLHLRAFVWCETNPQPGLRGETTLSKLTRSKALRRQLQLDTRLGKTAALMLQNTLLLQYFTSASTSSTHVCRLVWYEKLCHSPSRTFTILSPLIGMHRQLFLDPGTIIPDELVPPN